MNTRDYNLIWKERQNIAEGLTRFNSLQEAILAMEERFYGLDKSILSVILELERNSQR